MSKRTIQIKWKGPYIYSQVKKQNDGGTKDDNWNGDDYGLYQIYGKHILVGKNALLYVGQAAEQTFSKRFRQHYNDWLKHERGCRIYLGRIDTDPTKNKKWQKWHEDITMAEATLVYKYTPNYNSSLKQDYPKLTPSRILLIHKGNRGKLQPKDRAPEDYEYKKLKER